MSKHSELFLKSLGAVYLIAFLSLWTQIDGLIGQNGIVPLNLWLNFAKNNINYPYFNLATLSWISSSDAFLHFLCLTGSIFSIILIIYSSNYLILFILWLIYLSLCVDSQVFLGFQWDNLLLETGFLAILLKISSSRLTKNLFKILLFKIIFSSGVVKLSSGDPTWRDASALSYHFLTQPLPVKLSWFASQLPSGLLKACCYSMFFVELVVPFGIFFNGKIREISLYLIILFMFLIFISGNYTFFNVLTAIIAIFLINADKGVEPNTKLNMWVTPLVLLYTFVSVTQIIDTFRMNFTWPALVQSSRELIDPFRSINSYGLFQVMTTRRLEIEIQGTNTPQLETSWKPYVFKFKPGPLDRPPLWCQPHQPRLDWQLWFAALSSPDQEPWYLNFLVRLLQGKKEVLALLEKNPFPDAPPKYIRGILYEYRFTSANERRKTGNWWTRMELGPYNRPISLADK